MRHVRLGGVTQPASQAVLSALQAGLIRRAVREQEEARGSWKFEEMLVEAVGHGAFVFQQSRSCPTDELDIGLSKAEEVHQLLDKPRHIGARGEVLRAAHSGILPLMLGVRSAARGRGRPLVSPSDYLPINEVHCPLTVAGFVLPPTA